MVTFFYFNLCRPSPLLHPGHGHGLPREESQVQQMEGGVHKIENKIEQ